MESQPLEPTPPEQVPESNECGAALLAGEEGEMAGAPAGESPRQGWSYWDIAVVIALALGAQVLVYLFGLFSVLLLQQARGARFSYAEVISSAFFIVLMQLVWWMVVFWLVYRVVRARDPRSFPQAIGWVRPALPLGTYLGAGALLAVSVAGLAWLIPMPHHRLPIERLFRDPASAFLLAGFGVFIAPAIEELVFRGFLYPVMARAHGTVAAVAGTAALFSLVHAQQYGWAWQNLLLLGYVGVVFGAVRAVSGSLVPSTLMHAAYNFALFAGLFAASNRFHKF